MFKEHDVYTLLDCFKDQSITNLKCHEKNFYNIGYENAGLDIEKLNIRLTGTHNYFNSYHYKFPDNVYFAKNLKSLFADQMMRHNVLQIDLNMLPKLQVFCYIIVPEIRNNRYLFPETNFVKNESDNFKSLKLRFTEWHQAFLNDDIMINTL